MLDFKCWFGQASRIINISAFLIHATLVFYYYIDHLVQDKHLDYILLKVSASFVFICCIIIYLKEKGLMLNATCLDYSLPYNKMVIYLSGLIQALASFENYTDLWQGMAANLHQQGITIFEGTYKIPSLALKPKQSLVGTPAGQAKLTSVLKPINDQTSQKKVQSSKGNSSQGRKKSLKEQATAYCTDCFVRSIIKYRDQWDLVIELKIQYAIYLLVVVQDLQAASDLIEDLKLSELPFQFLISVYSLEQSLLTKGLI